jgi:hypothetical protein
MNILVITPAGPVAERIIRELIAPEFSVRLLADNPGEVSEDVRSAVETVSTPDGSDTEWQTVLSGIDAILWCHSSVGAEPVGIAPQQLMRAIQSRSDQPRPWIVTISGAGEENWEAAFEGAIARHLRCDVLMETFLWQTRSIAQGVIAGPTSPETLVPLVSAAEIADAALRWLVRPNWTGAATELISGSIALSHAHIAEMLQEVLNHPVTFRQLSPAAFIQWLRRCGVNPHSAHATAAAFILERDRSPANFSHVASRDAFRVWAEQEFAPFAAESSGCSEANCCCTI